MNLSKGNQEIIRRMPLLEALQACGGYYQCPKDKEGNRLGPLVGYAGRDEKGRQFVGDTYLNMAALEEYPHILWPFVGMLNDTLSSGRNGLSDRVFCGAPLGGMALASFMALRAYGRYVFPEKEVLDVATHLTREKSRLVFDRRHEIHEGDQVVVVEDVCNNFSTTKELIKLISSYGGLVVAIACLANRSLTIHKNYDYPISQTEGQLIPIRTLMDKPIPQYSQDDQAVVADVTAENVIWKPKDKWAELMDVMNSAGTVSP